MDEAGSTGGGMPTVQTVVVGPLEANAYVVSCPRTGRAVIIDPGDEPERILEVAAGLALRAILATHGHPDHLGAATALQAALGLPVHLHPADPPPRGVREIRPLADRDEIHIGGVTLRVVHTPGHTPGSVCFLGGGCLFSGDTLFPGGPGATEGGAAFAQVMASLRGRLFTLPDHTRVLPGHGPATTIGTERPDLDEWERRGW